jgi:hypothetical protein
MSTKFNPLVRKGFDKVGITLDDLPPALDALVVDDTATVDLTLTGDTLTADVKNNSITYAKIQNVSAENKILGRITAGAGDTEELTAANVRTIINVEDGADVTDATNVGTAGAAMAGGAFHDGFSDFVANEHIDWTADQGATDIHPGNIPDLSGTYMAVGSVTQYTDEMAQDAVGGVIGTGLSYDDSTGVISCTITQYEDADAVAAVGTPWTGMGYLTSVTPHDLLSATHGDTTASAVARGDLIVGTGDTPKWDNLAIGTAGKVLISDGTDVGWSASALGTAAFADTGDFLASSTVLPSTEAGSANNFLTAYNSATGAWTKARPTWANIDKTTSDIADLTTKSHISLSDIGTNTHAQIDTFIGTTVPTTYAPLVSPSFTTPTLGVAQATSVDVGNGSTIFGSDDDLTMTVKQHASAPTLNLYPAGGSLTSSRFAFRCVEGTSNFARFQGCTGTTAALASSNTMGIVEFAITQADPDPLKGVINFWTNSGDSVALKATLNETGVFNAVGGFSDNGSAGIDTTFVDNDGNTITVKGGIITAKTAP